MAELRNVSHDPSCRHLVTLRDGRKMTAVQLQMEYLELARKYTEDKYGADVDEATSDVLDRWESVLSRLAEDPMLTARELDWVTKLEILEGYRSRDGLALEPPAAPARRPAVLRRPPGQGPVQPAGRPRAGRPADRRGRTSSGP